MYKNLKDDVDNGITLSQIIIGYAASFGSDINEKGDLAPTKALEKLIKVKKQKLARIDKLTVEEAEELNRVEYDNDITKYDALVESSVALRKKYSSLIQQLKDWNTSEEPEQINMIKTAAISDLNHSMEISCYIPKHSPIKVGGEQWRLNQIIALNMELDELNRVKEDENKLISLVNASIAKLTT